MQEARNIGLAQLLLLGCNRPASTCARDVGADKERLEAEVGTVGPGATDIADQLSATASVQQRVALLDDSRQLDLVAHLVSGTHGCLLEAEHPVCRLELLDASLKVAHQLDHFLFVQLSPSGLGGSLDCVDAV
ncbi:MAG: hypothetical protein ACLGIW_03305 [Gammaproteobacteria bacterium]